MLQPAFKAFITNHRHYGSISFHLPNGYIGTHVMWVDADDDHVLINTEVHRAKYDAIEANPRVTVVVWDNANPYYYVEMRGDVVDKVHGPAARTHIDRLAQRYLGTDYPNPIESARVILKIRPNRQRGRLP